jgi:fucose 4-O-acetylase-like acetyltransferase
MSAVAPMAASVDAAASERTDWIDAAKGMGIVLVVLGHAIGGLHDARLMADDDAWQTVFYVIYTFHMPLFFFLSGLFVEKRVRAQPARFAESLFTRIAWPYFLWCTFQLMVISLLGTLVNVPSSFDLWRCVELVWKPASQFWYLHALFVMHAASLLVVPRYGTKGLLVLALFVMALPALVPLGSLKEVCRYAVYYAFGVVCSSQVSRGAIFDRKDAVTGAVAALLCIACAMLAHDAGERYSSFAAVPAAVAGTVAFVMLARSRFAQTNGILLALGRASQAIFLLHVLCVAGTRIVMNKLLSMGDTNAILSVATTAGVVGPFLAHHLASRMKWSKLFGLG